MPVDVVPGEDLQSVFNPDISFKLQALVPSYSVRRIPTDDGSIFVRPLRSGTCLRTIRWYW